MLTTTTNSVDGKTIRDYLGVIAGEAVMGVNMFRDMFAGIRNLVGGRTASYERELENARGHAMGDLHKKAQALGADAVIGVDIDYEVIDGGSGAMLLVSISGTAVKLR